MYHSQLSGFSCIAMVSGGVGRKEVNETLTTSSLKGGFYWSFGYCLNVWLSVSLSSIDNFPVLLCFAVVPLWHLEK